MDPFLYESRHSLPRGKGSFLEGGNAFFCSCCSLRWAEFKLHPAHHLHSQDQSWLALASRNSLPSSSPVRSWEIFPFCLGTEGRNREGLACLHVVMQSFFFKRNTPAAATSTSYVLGDSSALYRWKEGSREWREGLEMQTATLQIHLGQIESVRTAWMEGRAEHGREMAGRLCFMACQVRIHYPLAILFLISPLMCCEALPACLPAMHGRALSWAEVAPWPSLALRQCRDWTGGKTRNEGRGNSTQRSPNFKTAKVFLSRTWRSLLCP